MATDRPDPPPKEAENDARTATVCAAVIGAVFTIGAFFVGGGRTAMSVAIGAAIAVANLLMMRAIVSAVIEAPADPEQPEKAEKSEGEEPGPAPDHKAEGRRGGAAWGVFALLKLFLLFGGIYLLLTRGLVDPIPLVVGYGVLPIGIAASTAVGSLRPRRRR